MVVIDRFKLQLWMWLADLHYTFECDWLIELPDSKLSKNNLTRELEEKKDFLNPITMEEIVISMIMIITMIKIQMLITINNNDNNTSLNDNDDYDNEDNHLQREDFSL